VNGVVYKNSFISLPNWILKKTFNCRKCFVELGLFYNTQHEIEKLIWLDFLSCEEVFYKKLIKLHETKEKNRDNEKKYYRTLDEIRKINNQIHLSKVKLGVKFRLEHRGIWLKHSLN
tara:strand:+ start:53 stop:403 length:351 start_codon:yes stop_codon:yes gene_type:complete